MSAGEGPNLTTWVTGRLDQVRYDRVGVFLHQSRQCPISHNGILAFELAE
jgi:hypothetical protein